MRNTKLIQMANKFSPFEQLFRASRAKRQVTEDFLYKDNVVGVGVGFKNAHNSETITPSIVVSVTEKVPKNKLDRKQIIPSVVDDVYTDVIETGFIKAQIVDRDGRVRPIAPGISIGHIDATAGTLGAIVRRGSEVFVLSNNHVLAELDDAKLGDPIIQPGSTDGGSLQDRIGTLAGFIPITLYDELQAPPPREIPGWVLTLFRIFGIETLSTPSPTLGLNNTVDAAIARLDDGASYSATIVDLNTVPQGILPPYLGMPVVKSGRTTGVTTARVIQIDVTTDVNYGSRKARFTDQIMTTPFSHPGDSGSLVLDTEQNAVGLLFAGSEKISVVTPIQTVLGELNLELITSRTVVHSN